MTGNIAALDTFPTLRGLSGAQNGMGEDGRRILAEHYGTEHDAFWTVVYSGMWATWLQQFRYNPGTVDWLGQARVQIADLDTIKTITGQIVYDGKQPVCFDYERENMLPVLKLTPADLSRIPIIANRAERLKIRNSTHEEIRPAMALTAEQFEIVTQTIDSTPGAHSYLSMGREMQFLNF